MDLKSINSKWDKALSQLWSRSRFTSYFYRNIRLKKKKSIPTLALTISHFELTLFYNPKFIVRINEEELIGLLVHEMLHVILNHQHRSKEKETLYWQNIAQDMVVNSFIINKKDTFFADNKDSKAKFSLVLPPNLPVIPKKFFLEKRNPDPSWEEVYAWIKEKINSDSQSKSFFSFSSGTKKLSFSDKLYHLLKNPLDIPKHLENDFIKLEDKMALPFTDSLGEFLPTGIHVLNKPEITSQIQAKKEQFLNYYEQENGPEIERGLQGIYGLIKKTTKIKTSPWERKIKSIIDYNSTSPEIVYSYSRFNRRYLNNGIYTPGRIFQAPQFITVAVDVSGSMVIDSTQLETAFGVLEKMLSKYKINLVCIDEKLFIPQKKNNIFVSGDDTTAKNYFYEKGDWKLLKTGSKGTTFFAPLFNKYLQKHREMLIVITDGQIYDLEKLKKYHSTLWLLPEKKQSYFQSPFGQTLYINNE